MKPRRVVLIDTSGKNTIIGIIIPEHKRKPEPYKPRVKKPTRIKRGNK